MPIHVAILKRPYLDLILAGRKTVESRLTRTAVPPYRRIEPGERLFLKVSGGPFAATAVAGEVVFFEDLSAARVERLRRRYQPTVGGDNGYWRAKRGSRFAVFIELTRVEPLDVGPDYRKVNMKAWHVLDDRLNPLRDVALTAGAIRNRYALAPPDLSRAAPLHLRLPDGTSIQTTVARGRMLRWRGWGAHYRRHGSKPGDVMRFLAVGPRTYRVSFHAAAR